MNVRPPTELDPTSPPDVEALFQQFRRRGDPACLGEVFDACADELFVVALHLARDRAAAEDLVQATFLVAIERAQRWQPGRPLRPWLLGILHREAKRSRRRARRAVDAARVVVPSAPEPPQQALAAEARSAVLGALGALPQPYRDVLELHLLQTLAPAAIAERLQRSPGAVRTQLWRGMELLRRALPAGLGVALAAAIGAQVPLAAVRANVLTAAAARAAAAAAGAGGGAGAVAGFGAGAAVGALAWLARLARLAALPIVVLLGGALALGVWRGAAAPPLASATPLVVADVPAVAAGGGSRPSDAVSPTGERATRVEPTASAARAEPAPAAPLPAPLVVSVVDVDGRPVADALVAVFDPAAQRRASLHARAGDPGDAVAPSRRLATDAHGRVHLALLDESALLAERGTDRSARVEVRPASSRAHRDVRLVLRPTAEVRGVVLGPDGAPAAGAQVRGTLLHDDYLATLAWPPTTTDDRGGFVVRAIVDPWPYLVHATSGATESLRQRVPVRDGAAVECTIRLPGAFTVSGALLDRHGAPARGRIVLSGGRDDTGEALYLRADSDDAGRFAFALATAGAFDLLGGVDGETPARARVDLTAAAPHAHVSLRTSPWCDVRGIVVDERGEPIAGREVGMATGSREDTLQQTARELAGTVAPATTDAAGRFVVRAPAAIPMRAAVQAIPGDRTSWVVGDEIEAPVENVMLIVRDADRRGLVVHGRVVADHDGGPVGGATIERVTLHGNGSSSGGAGRTDTDGAFRIGPFRTDARYRFTFAADGFAKTSVGPFDATVREEELVVRMQRCGAVRCGVLRADGTPAARAFVSLQAPVHDPFGPAWQGETDAAGEITLRDVPPGPYTVHAMPTLAGRTTLAEVVVRPAQTSAVQIELQ